EIMQSKSDKGTVADRIAKGVICIFVDIRSLGEIYTSSQSERGRELYKRDLLHVHLIRQALAFMILCENPDKILLVYSGPLDQIRQLHTTYPRCVDLQRGYIQFDMSLGSPGSLCILIKGP